MDPVTVPVSEVFGPVWQGEGPHAGRRCSFLRLGLCNLHCEWCDTPFTWDRDRYDVNAECPPRTAEQVLDTLCAHNTDLLILSGGEPLIHANNPALTRIIGEWVNIGGRVDLETNGTLPPPAWWPDISVAAISPKIAQDADPMSRRIRPAALKAWAKHPGAYLKLVARTARDVHLAARHVPDWGDWEGRVWIMPEGTTAEKILGTARDIEQAVTDNGFHLSLRMHTLIYGTERAR